METKEIYTAGSRKSQLAVIQTQSVVDLLAKHHPNVTCKIETMETIGDKILDRALPKVGEKSLFTKDLEIALEGEKVDFIVHSLKDLPTTIPETMVIGAVLKRNSPNDAVLFHPKHKGKCLSELPSGSIIGTSSLRRIAQLRRKYPSLEFKNIRGNLNTRLRKLEESGEYDALVLAAAGVYRMNWQEKIGQILEDKDCLYAVGQGALAVEVRLHDSKMLNLLWPLTDITTLLCCAAERSFLRVLEGGCSVPVGVSSCFANSELTLVGAVLSLDGQTCIKDSVTASVYTENKTEPGPLVTLKNGLVVAECYKTAVLAAEDIGSTLAMTLKEKGASDILSHVRSFVDSTQDIHKPIKY